MRLGEGHSPPLPVTVSAACAPPLYSQLAPPGYSNRGFSGDSPPLELQLRSSVSRSLGPPQPEEFSRQYRSMRAPRDGVTARDVAQLLRSGTLPRPLRTRPLPAAPEVTLDMDRTSSVI